jgi:hypothetical protein
MSIRTAVSLADLAQSFAELRPDDPETRRWIAKMLGFDAVTPLAPTEHTPAPGPPRPAQPATLSSPAVEPPLPVFPEPEPHIAELPKEKGASQPTLTFDLQGPVRGQPLASAEEKPTWWRQVTVFGPHRDPAKVIQPEPLFVPLWSRTTCAQKLSTVVLEGGLDLPRLVDQVARLEAPEELPRLPWPTMRRGVQVLVDQGDAMLPFREDQRRLVREVRELAGSSAFFEAFLFRGAPTQWARPFNNRSALQRYALPPSGVPILALTDLGIGALAAGQPYTPPEEWITFARLAESAGCPLRIFLPYALDRCPPLLRHELALIHWHHARGVPAAHTAMLKDGLGEAEEVLADLRQRNPSAVALAHLAALASRVELSLLRELRLALLPAADGGAEADLWFSPLASLRSESALLLRPEVAHALRRNLFRSEPALFQAAWGVVDNFRKRTHAFVGARLEEEVNYWLAQGGAQAEARVQGLLRRAVKTIYERGAQDEEGLALWSLELLDGLPAEARQSEAGKDLGVAAGFRLDPGYVPANLLPDDLGNRQWLIPLEAASLPTDDLWVARTPTGLVFADQEELVGGGQRLQDAPVTHPFVLWLTWDGGKQREKVSIMAGQKAGPIDTGEHPVTIETFTGTRWTLTPSTAQASIEETPAHMETMLDWSSRGLSELPDELFAYSNLQVLDLSRNQLTTLPARIGDLVHLQELILNQNRLTALPAAIGKLTTLESLRASGNRIEHLPPELAQLANLRGLDLSQNLLSDLTEALNQLSQLQELNLSGNRLENLPAWIGKLTNLQNLNLARNQLNELPQELGQLTALQTLDLRDNPLALADGVLADVILTQMHNPLVILQEYWIYRALVVHYDDLEFRILKREANGYPVELTLNDERQFGRGYLDPAFLPWAPSAEPAADGERLFAWLLTHEHLKRVWAEVRDQHPQRRIRLRIDAEAPELHAVPWELLADPSNGHVAYNLAAANATPFSRYLAGQWEPGSPIRKRPIRVLVAIANPIGLAAFNLSMVADEPEWLSLQTAVAGMPVELVRYPDGGAPCTLAGLSAELHKGYHALHFIGLSAFNERTGQAMLSLADEQNNVSWATDQEIANVFAATNDLRLVFLEISQASSRKQTDAFRVLAPKLVQAGVPAVLAMQDLVPAQTARVFAGVFYRQLLQHGLVDLATNEARASLLATRSADASIPVLYMRIRDGRLFQPAERKVTQAKDQSKEELVLANGINGATGEYLSPPISLAVLAEIIQGQPSIGWADVGGVASDAQSGPL